MSMRLRDRPPVNYQSSHLGFSSALHPDKPAFLHKDPVFNPELSKHCAFPTLPFNHEGPGPSEVWKKKSTGTQSISSTLDETNETASVVVPAPPQHARPKKRLLCNTLVNNTYSDDSSDSDSDSDDDESEDDSNNKGNNDTATQIANKERFYTTPRRNSHVLQPIRRPIGSFLLSQNNREGVPGRKDGLKYDSPLKDWVKAAEKREDDLSRGLNSSTSARNALAPPPPPPPPPQTGVCRNNNSPQNAAAAARGSGGPRQEQNAATTGSNSSEIRWERQSTPDGFYRHDYDWRSPPLGQTVSGWADLSMSSSSEDDPFVEVPKNTPVEPAAAAGKPTYKSYLERVRLVDEVAAARNAEDDRDRTITEPGDQPGDQGRKFKPRTLGLRQPDWFALSQGIRYLIIYELTRLDMSFVRIVRTLKLTAKEVIDLLNLIGTENHKIYQMEAIVKHHTETQSVDCEALWQQIPDPVTVDITGRDIQNAKVFLAFVGLGDVADKLDQYHGVCTKSAYQIEFRQYQEEGLALPPSFEFNCGPFAGNIWELWRTRQLEQEPGYWERQQAEPQTEPAVEADSAVEAEPVESEPVHANAQDGPQSPERNSQPRVVLPPVANLLNVADAAWRPNGWQPNVDWSLFNNVPQASFSGDPVPIGEFYQQLNRAQDGSPANLRHNTPVEPLWSNQVVSQNSGLPGIGALLDPFVDNEDMNQHVEGGQFKNAMGLGDGYYYDAYPDVGGTAEAPITIGDDDQNRGLYNGPQLDPYEGPGDTEEDPIEYQGAPNGDLPPEFFINSLMEKLDERDGSLRRAASRHRAVQPGPGSAGNSRPIPPSPDFEWPTLEISDDEVGPAVRQGDEGPVTERPVVREFVPTQRRPGHVNEELAKDPVLNYAKPVLLHPDEQLLKSINDILKKYGRQRTHEQVFADRDLTPTPEPESESEGEPAPAAASSPPRYGDPDDDVWVPAVSRRRKAPASRRRSPPPPKSDDDEDDDWKASRPRAARAPRQRRPAVTAEPQPRKRKQATDAEDAPRRKRGRPPKNPNVITQDRLPAEPQLPLQPAKRASGSRRKAEPKLDESCKPIQASKVSGTKRQAEPHDGDDQVPKRRNTGSRRRPSIPIPSSEVGAMLPPPLPSSQLSVDAEDIAEANARRRDRSKSTADMDAIFVNGLGGQLTRREVSALPNVQYMPGGRYGGGKWLEKDTNIIWKMLNPIQQVKKPWIYEGAKAKNSRTPAPSLPPVPEAPASIGPPTKEPHREKQPASLGIRPWLEGEPLNLFQQELSPFPNISNDAVYHRLWEDNMMTRREFRTYTDFQLYVLRLGEEYFKAGNKDDEALPASQSSTQGSDRRLSNAGSVTGEQSTPVSPHHTSADKNISRTMVSSSSPPHGKGPISAAHRPHTGGKGMDSILAIYSYLHQGGSEDEEEERADNQSNSSKNSEADDDDHNESDSENVQFPRGQGKTYELAPGGGQNANYLEEAEKCEVVDVMDTDYSESGEEPSTDEDEEDEW